MKHTLFYRTPGSSYCKLVLFVFMCFAAAAARGQTAGEIVKKYYEAVGGQNSWNKVNSLKSVFVLVSDGQDVHGSETIAQGKGYRKEINMQLAGRAMNTATVITPDAGWVYNSFAGKSTLLSAEKLKSSLHTFELHDPLQMFIPKGAVAYVGKDTAQGQSCFKVKSTDDAGLESFLYFDMNSGLLLRVDAATKENGREVRSVTDLADYRKLPEGISVPMKQMLKSANAATVTITYQSVAVNQPVDESLFKRQM